METLAGDSSIGYVDDVGTTAKFSSPSGCFMNDGYALIADTVNHVIRYVALDSGEVTTVSGHISGSVDGTGTEALFNTPTSIVAFTTLPFAMIADSGNCCIRSMSLITFAVSIFAGQFNICGIANGFGTNALFIAPQAIAIDPKEKYMLVTDSGACLIKKVIIATQQAFTFTGTTCTDAADGIGETGFRVIILYLN